MTLPIDTIYTGTKLFRQKILIESTGDKAVDAAFKTIFHDQYHRTAPLEMRRADVQLVLNWTDPEKYPIRGPF